MLNHSPKANLRWKGNRESHALEIFALDDIDIGEELTISYGTSALGNKDTLKSYGFTQSDEELVKRDTLEFTDNELADACYAILTASGVQVSYGECTNAILSYGHSKDTVDGKLTLMRPDYIDHECQTNTRNIRHFMRELAGISTEKESE